VVVIDRACLGSTVLRSGGDDYILSVIFSIMLASCFSDVESGVKRLLIGVVVATFGCHFFA